MYNTDSEEIDFLWCEEILDKQGSAQCIFCGGWALTCPCEENCFSKEEKQEIMRYLENMEKYPCKQIN